MNMKVWRRRVAILLALLLLAGQCAGLAEAPEAAATAEPAEESHITVANTTPLTGIFFPELWGNGSSDVDVRYLLHGYNLVMWDGENGQFVPDPSVVSGITVTEDADGNRSYHLVLYDDLKYSDGSPITARDYAFSWLLTMSPEIEALGGVPANRDFLLGYQDYMRAILPTEGAGEDGLAEGERYEAGMKLAADGTRPFLRGLHVISDDTLVFTVRAEALPFFYELGMLSCVPYPIGQIAPGVLVRDDGEGCCLANADETVAEPVFTAELLRSTLLDPEEGYVYNPGVVSGPYTLAGFDGVTAELEANPQYKGDHEGRKPTIQRLSFTLAQNETMLEKLRSGEIDVLNRITRADVIGEGMQLIREGGFGMTNYPRTGVGGISFACERPGVNSPAVRQAIAWCMDRDAIVKDYTGGFGLRADGYYGIGQWMYGVVQGTVVPPVEAPEDPDDAAAQTAYETELAEWQALNLDKLTDYELDLDRAAALLDQEGWVLNEEGQREKEGVVLSLTLAYPEGNAIGESLQTHLADNLAQIGVQLTLEPASMADMLRRFYRQPLAGDAAEEAEGAQSGIEGDGEVAPRDVDMIFMASNFDVLFDPAARFTTGVNGEPSWANTENGDRELYDLALAMRQTDSANPLEYMQKWIAFEERFNENLPMIPIYTNIYFDFYTNRLHDYPVDKSFTWSGAILGATLSEEAETPEPTPTAEPSPAPTAENADEGGEDGLIDIP